MFNIYRNVNSSKQDILTLNGFNAENHLDKSCLSRSC